jgi:hypothetical protein
VVIFYVKKLSIREDRMGLLMLKCPSTGKELSTRIITDEETFKKIAQHGHQGELSALRAVA